MKIFNNLDIMRMTTLGMTYTLAVSLHIMKNILWIFFILIILFILFLQLGSKNAAYKNRNQSSTQLETNIANSESTTHGKTVQLNVHAAIKAAWLTVPPPGSQVSALYMKIFNSGNVAIKIVAMESEDFDEMMFHRTIIENGMARMESIDYLEIPAGDSLLLEPNGLHIMAIDPERELKVNDKVKIDFTLSDGKSYSVTVPVR